MSFNERGNNQRGLNLLDISATKAKEIYIQAELYRLLRNKAIHLQRIIPRGPVPAWSAKDVLIEATIRDDGKTKEADIVLLTSLQLEFDRVKIKPALVIEIKTRKFSRLSVSYGAYLRQAYNYTVMIGCSNYAVYDGKNFILMQLAEPYMIGFTDFSTGRDEKEDIKNIGKIWHAARILSENFQTEALPDFKYHSDIDLWRKTIPVLIRQAFQRNARRSGREPTLEEVEKTGERLGKKWLEMHDLKL